MTRTVKRIKHKCASLFFLLVPWSTCFLCFSYESTEVESCLTDSPKVTYLISNRIWVMLTLEDLGLFPLPYLLWALAKRDRSCLSWTRQLLTREEKTAIEGKTPRKSALLILIGNWPTWIDLFWMKNGILTTLFTYLMMVHLGPSVSKTWKFFRSPY